MNKFDIVTPDWIRQQLKEKKVSQKEFAEGVNTISPRVSEWLSGTKKPSAAAKAAVWYYFQNFT